MLNEHVIDRIGAQFGVERALAQLMEGGEGLLEAGVAAVRLFDQAEQAARQLGRLLLEMLDGLLEALDSGVFVIEEGIEQQRDIGGFVQAYTPWRLRLWYSTARPLFSKMRLDCG